MLNDMDGFWFTHMFVETLRERANDVHGTSRPTLTEED
jgi:hypothetical protein